MPKSEMTSFVERKAYEKAKRLLVSADLHMSLEDQKLINWMGEAFAGVAVQKMSQQIKDEFMNHKKMFKFCITNLKDPAWVQRAQ